MNRMLENNMVTLLVLISTIIGSSFVVAFKVDQDANTIRNLKNSMNRMSRKMNGEIEKIQIDIAVLKAQNNMRGGNKINISGTQS